MRRTANFHARHDADIPELLIYDEIGPGWLGMIDGALVKHALNEIGRESDVLVRVNSPGGDVFESVAIYNALASHEGRVLVSIDALAASGASLLAMAGDRIEMAESAMMMIHRAWTIVAGNAPELAKHVETLEKIDGRLLDIYTARSGGDRDELEAMLDAETWLSADEALDAGLADSIGTPLKTPEAKAPSIAQGRYKNTPPRFLSPDPSQRVKRTADFAIEIARAKAQADRRKARIGFAA